jgi:3D (Asp-Asp-Asp) domain-containing protein
MKKRWITLTVAGALTLTACASMPAQACEILQAGRCTSGYPAASTERNGQPGGTYARADRLDAQAYHPGATAFAPGAPYGSNRCSLAFPGFPSAALPPGCRQQPLPAPVQQASYLPASAPETKAPQSAAAAQAAGGSSESNRTYVVKKGDTLYRIAQTYDTTVELLMVENRITDPTLLQIGQVLTIPPSREAVAAWLKSRQNKVAKVLNATLTAYTAGFESTGKTPAHPAYGITSSGTKVKANHTIAVDPDVIPMGAFVYIEGIGLRQAEDTGSAIKGARIDVYIPDLKQALEFGVKKNVTVYVLDDVPRNNAVRIASSKP